MPTLTRPHVRVLASAVLALVAGIGGVATAGAASAEAPVDLVEEVTDHAGVLSPQDAEAVAARLDALADSTPYQLFVVYVGSFDGMAPADWADETAVGSGLGRDDILLAVAVDDRQYQVSVAQEIALTDDQLGDVEADRIEPALRDDDWAGAAVAAADGYEAAAAGDASGEDPVGVVTGRSFGVSWPALGAGVGGLALLVTGVVVVPWQVRRRRAAAAAEADLDAMDGRASSALVAVDEAVATSTQELGFAEAELGATTTAPFAAALDAARTELAAAFGARQRLDDTQPESDDERRALLTQILDACARVDAALDAQTAEFVRLRDLHARVPQVLVEAAEQAVRLAARTDVTESSLNDLAARYAPSALAAVAGNVDDTRAVLDRARAATAQGTATLDTDRAAAVAAAQVAVDALAQAAALLDAVDATARDLAQAPDRLVQACADLDADLGDAARLGAGDPAVALAVDGARAALQLARSTTAAADPLRALAETRAAERALDQVLDPLREAEAARARAVERLPHARAQVDAELAAASAVMSAHRSAVGATARTRLAEAHRHVEQSAVLGGTDPVGALRALDTAGALAAAARQLADQDVAAERSRELSRSWSTSSGGGSGWGGSGGGWGDWGSGGSGGGFGGGFSGGTSRSRSSSSSRRSSSSRSSSRSSSSRRSSSSGRSRRGGGGRF